MANNTKTLDEYLAEKGISGWYAWRPNQLYTKDPSNPDKYVSVDIVTGSMINDMADVIEATANQHTSEIDRVGKQKKDEIENYDMTYFAIKDICLDTFHSLLSYFSQTGRVVEQAIVEKAIERINELQ